ncbi:MAG TPA: phosphate ABC transporter substrate-binding protein PstS [Solirubrobacteraceae bacterium]|nr:phosphate ABC transporter substrate-binding protein PstS [Solirubrobacteraceae bacterium]
MSSRKLAVGLIVAAITLLGTASAFAATISEGGSTFALPFWQQLASSYNKANSGSTVNVNVGASGSGGGRTSLQNETIQIAGSDNVSPAADAGKYKGGAIQHLPIAFGGITLAYNVPGVPNNIKLTGAIIANIYLGKIGSWDNKSITKLNPGVKFPHAQIQVVHRSGNSGTTAGFTEFLAVSSNQWAQKYGGSVQDLPRWPVGLPGATNAAVAQLIDKTQNSIGYVEQSYAIATGMKVASVQNAKGVFIKPTVASVAAAGDGVYAGPSLTIDAINSKAKAAYPITSQTFAIVYKNLCAGASADQAKLTKGFLTYALGSEGQGQIRKLYYAPLPAKLLTKVQSAVKALQTC